MLMSQLNDQKSYQTQYTQFVSKYPNFIRNVKTDKHFIGHNHSFQIVIIHTKDQDRFPRL